MTLPVAPPTPQPVTPVNTLKGRPRRGRAPVMNLISLVLSALLLAATVAAGMWLISTAPGVPQSPTAQRLSSSAARSFYGGDAYTGIQNAAADTENSVVAAANASANHASTLQASQLDAEAAWWGHLWKGLSALIIVIAAGNFITTLQRFGSAQRR